jgi:hypothetical protein
MPTRPLVCPTSVDNTGLRTSLMARSARSTKPIGHLHTRRHRQRPCARTTCRHHAEPRSTCPASPTRVPLNGASTSATRVDVVLAQTPQWRYVVRTTGFQHAIPQWNHAGTCSTATRMTSPIRGDITADTPSDTSLGEPSPDARSFTNSPRDSRRRSSYSMSSRLTGCPDTHIRHSAGSTAGNATTHQAHIVGESPALLRHHGGDQDGPPRLLPLRPHATDKALPRHVIHRQYATTTCPPAKRTRDAPVQRPRYADAANRRTTRLRGVASSRINRCPRV